LDYVPSMLAMHAKKNIPLEIELSFENSAVLLSLFVDDVSFLSGKNDILMKNKFQDLLPEVEPW